MLIKYNKIKEHKMTNIVVIQDLYERAIEHKNEMKNLGFQKYILKKEIPKF